MILDLSSWLLALIGGLLIGSASLALLYFNGRISGISGITGGVLSGGGGGRGERLWRAAFLLGLVGGGVALLLAYPEAFAGVSSLDRSYGALIGAGACVGVGTRLGSGCTSGHGVCGMSRLSKRSIVATMTFMLVAALVVAATTHLLGGRL